MSITAKFEADFNQFVGETKKAEAALKSVETSSGQVAASLTQVNVAGEGWSSWLSKASGLLGTFGIGLSAAAVVGFGKAIVDDADALVRLSDITGVSLQGLQKFQIAGDDAGNTVEELTAAIAKMEDRLVGGDKSAEHALNKLGLSFEDLKGKSPETQFIDISDSIRKIKDPAEQVNIAIDLFGKQGASILPTLKRGFDDLKDAVVGMGDGTIRTLDKTGDKFEEFKRRTKAEAGTAFAFLIDNFSTTDDSAAGLAKQLAAMQASAERAMPALAGIVPPGLPKDLDGIIEQSKQFDKLLKDNSELLRNVQKLEADRIDSASIGLLGLSKMEQELSQKRMEAAVQGIDQIKRAEDDLNDFIAKDSLDSASYQIVQIWRAADAKVAAFKGTTEQLAQFTAQVMDLAAREANAVVYEADRVLTTVTEKAVGAARAVQLAIEQVTAGQAVDVVANRLAAGVTGVGMQAPIYVSPPIFARAGGGPVNAGQSYMVGERGPELFRPSINGSILPNGAGNTVTNHFYVNGTADDVARKISKTLTRQLLDGVKVRA